MQLVITPLLHLSTKWLVCRSGGFIHPLITAQVVMLPDQHMMGHQDCQRCLSHNQQVDPTLIHSFIMNMFACYWLPCAFYATSLPLPSLQCLETYRMLLNNHCHDNKPSTACRSTVGRWCGLCIFKVLKIRGSACMRVIGPTIVALHRSIWWLYSDGCFINFLWRSAILLRPSDSYNSYNRQ